MNRATRRAAARTERRSGHKKVTALGSAAVLASAGAGAALVLSSTPAGANAPIVVTSLTDDGSGGVTLREAIEQANTDGGQDQITFSVTGTITLTSDLTAITDPVHINGPGAASLTIDGADTYRVLHFDHIYAIDGTDEVTGLTITHGNGSSNPDGSGGAIQVWYGTADMLLQDLVLTNNYTENDGGAVNFYDNTGSMVLDHVTVTDNVADSGGGALYADKGIEDGDLTITITNSIFTGNSATLYAGGALYLSDAAVTITDSVISGNDAHLGGGGLYITGNQSSLEVVNSTISGNSALYGGGGIKAASSTSVAIFNSTISGNSAGYYGGGLYSTAYATMIVQSTVSGNTASQAGGIFVGANGGAAILLSTITDNTATNPGTDPAVHGIQIWAPALITGTPEDGGPHDRHEKAHAADTKHRASESGARAADDPIPAGTAMLIGDIVAGNGNLDIGRNGTNPSANVQTIGSVLGTIEPVHIVVTDGGHNQIGVTAAAVNLGPLADNGGPTKTHALLPGSVAIDAGPAATDLPTFPGEEYDQRGTPYTRIVNGTVDAGAYEVQPPPAPEPTFTG